MPSSLTYPGVYIEEVPSRVRTLTGVATAVAAFVGRTQRGPVNQGTTINSFADFERIFGGLWLDSPMTYAVQDYFRNGGSQAVIARLYKSPVDKDGKALSGSAVITLDTLKLEAVNPGSWGSRLSAVIDLQDVTTDVAKDVASRLGVQTQDLFNLTVTYAAASGPTVERYTNLTVKDTVRRVDRVLRQSSMFVRVHRDVVFSDSLVAPKASQGSVNADATTALESQPLADNDYTLSALDRVDLFTILCIPPDRHGGDTSNVVYTSALDYCSRRRAILLVDPPTRWTGLDPGQIKATDLGLAGPAARNAAVYYPRVRQANVLRGSQIEEFVPCGIVAGVLARTDTTRGIWKAPAGLDAGLSGVDALTVRLTDAECGQLNPQGINCLRTMPASGQVIWGARTLRGADGLADEYKYLSVRRLALYLEESIYRGTQWVVFEPNDEPLWGQIRLNLGSFMQNLFRQGAFQGKSPREAYLVKCDKETTTQADINAGVVNIVVGFAPLKPAEFVVIKFQQLAGQSAA